jgi:hypothetical protein
VFEDKINGAELAGGAIKVEEKHWKIEVEL